MDGNRCYTSAAAYDMAGRLLTLTYPDEDTGQLSSGSETVSYTYDALGRLVSVPGYATALQYTSDGQIKQMSYTNGGHDDLHLRPAAALAHRHPRL